MKRITLVCMFLVIFNIAYTQKDSLSNYEFYKYYDLYLLDTTKDTIFNIQCCLFTDKKRLADSFYIREGKKHWIKYEKGKKMDYVRFRNEYSWIQRLMKKSRRKYKKIG